MDIDFYNQQMSRSKKLFNRAFEQAEKANIKNNLNASISWSQVAAHLATIRHAGFYVDQALENLLIDVSHKIEQNAFSRLPRKLDFNSGTDSSKIRFLHVATETYAIGGHSAFITRWIRSTRENSIHSLIVTGRNNPIPESLSLAINESGGWHYILPQVTDDLVERALILRRIAASWADVIVLFIHPFDPIPLVAFGVNDGPPIAFCNHADHEFWLGASITDRLLEYHPLGKQISSKRRGINDSIILPIPLLKSENVTGGKEIRKKLGLDQEEVMILSVGRDEKFFPYKGVDFYEVMVEFLKQYSNAKLFVVGPLHQGKWIEASDAVNGRIRALGSLYWSALNELYDAADVYVPSFPCGSGTALLEACLHNLPVVGLQNMDLPHLTGLDDVGLEKFPVHANSADDFILLLSKFIDNPSGSKEYATKVRDSVVGTHCSPGWSSYLAGVMQSLPSQHKIRNLKDVSEDIDDSDFFLSYFGSRMLNDELIEYSFARLIRVYSDFLSKKDCIPLQARSLIEAASKVKGANKVKEYAYNLVEFLKSF